MPATAYDQAMYRVSHPHVVAWCEANIGDSSMAEVLQTEGLLSEGQTRVVESFITGERDDTGAPAEEWHAGWIPNGDYSIEYDNGYRPEHFDFRIHLVERGQLAGKRIVKMKRPGSSIYSGFGFVTRSGEFSLWRRFEREAQSSHVRAAIILLRSMTDNRASDGSASIANDLAATRAVNGADVGGESITYGINQVRCLHCNTVALPRHPYPLCVDHTNVPNRPVASVRSEFDRLRQPDPEMERLLDEEEAIERRTENTRRARAPMSNVSATVPGRTARGNPRRPRRAPANESGVPMSLVTGKHVL